MLTDRQTDGHDEANSRFSQFLQTQVKKKRIYGLQFFLFHINFQRKNRDRIPETFQSGKGFHGRKSLEISAVGTPAS